ncbi:MAG: hypothetical protein ACYDHP_07625 [Ferrimicrobium sp.]
MRELKLLDRTQPQTLLIGSLLLYLNAAFAILEVLFFGISFLGLLLAVILPVVGAYGVANSRRIGYYIALAATAIPLLYYVYILLTAGLSALLSVGLLSIILAVVPFALFIHPMSRQYVKLWFH